MKYNSQKPIVHTTHGAKSPTDTEQREIAHNVLDFPDDMR